MQYPLAEYDRSESWAEAESALDRLVERGEPQGLEVGERFDEVATWASEEDEFELAVRAQRKALAHGCRLPRLGRQMLGWYLLKGGHMAEGEREFAALLEDDVDDDVDTLLTLCLARADTARFGDALEAADLPLDRDDRLAPRPGIKASGRNQPCWCGSGQKYKRCCGR